MTSVAHGRTRRPQFSKDTQVARERARGRSEHSKTQSCARQLAPNLIEEWHPTKNHPLQPTNFTSRSGHKAWWICEFSHEYQAIIRKVTINSQYFQAKPRRCSYRVALSYCLVESTLLRLVMLEPICLITPPL